MSEEPREPGFDEDALAKLIEAADVDHVMALSALGTSKDKEEVVEDVKEEEELPDIKDVQQFDTIPPDITPEQQRDPYHGYSREPLTEDQYSKYKLSTKLGPTQAKIYNLGVPGEIDAYNRILAEADTPGAPRVIIVHNSTKETDDSWKVLVHYKEVWYKKALK